MSVLILLYTAYLQRTRTSDRTKISPFVNDTVTNISTKMTALPQMLWWSVAHYLDRRTINSLTLTHRYLACTFDETFWYHRAGGVKVCEAAHVVAQRLSWQKLCYAFFTWTDRQPRFNKLNEPGRMLAFENGISYGRLGGVYYAHQELSNVREMLDGCYLDNENYLRRAIGNNLAYPHPCQHVAYSGWKVLVLDWQHQVQVYDYQAFVHQEAPEGQLDFPFGRVERVAVAVDSDHLRTSYWLLTDKSECYCYLTKNNQGQYDYMVFRDVQMLLTLDEYHILLQQGEEYKILYTEDMWVREREQKDPPFIPHVVLKGRPFTLIENKMFSWKDYSSVFGDSENDIRHGDVILFP